jgi:biopolymer transport protein ExbD
MAFSVGQSGGGKLGRRFGQYGALAEMNVVPLVDVVLVLLIIFMLTAGAMEFGLDVQVPKVKQSRDTAEEMPVVTITRDGEIYLNEKEANINTLRDQVRTQFPNAKGVYLKADKAVTWDPIAQVISELGLKQDGKPPLEVKVVTQTADAPEKRRR